MIGQIRRVSVGDPMEGVLCRANGLARLVVETCGGHVPHGRRHSLLDFYTGGLSEYRI